MRTHLKVFPLFFLLICISCKSKMKDADNIYFRYALSYDENIDRTTVAASFYKAVPPEEEMKGESACWVRIPIELPKGSSISFNGTMLEHPKKSQYSHEYAGLVSGGTFTWVDAEGNTLINKLPAPERLGIPDLNVFNKNFELAFKYNGKLMDEGEFMDLCITDSGGKKYFTSVSKEQDGSVFCPVNQTYADGPSMFDLRRQTKVKVQESGKAGGEISIMYLAATKTVNIVSVPEQSDPPIKMLNNPY